MFTRASERQRGGNPTAKREKDGDAFENPQGDEFTSCLLFRPVCNSKSTKTREEWQDAVNYSRRVYSSYLKKERRILNALDPTMARVHQLPLCLSNEGTEPACSLSSSHFVQAHTETSICILCLQVINAQGSCNI